MKQAISGVAPAELEEVTVMDVWPSISAYPSGRFLGRLYSMRWPDVYIFRLGNLLALLSIPHALFLYFYRLLPSVMGLPLHGSFYKLTNRRVIEVRSEINVGEGSTALRVVAGLGLIIPAIVVWCLFQTFAFNWGIVPDGALSWLVTVICLAGVLMGLIPLFVAVPVPHFSYGVPTKSVELDRFDDIQIDRKPGQEWFDAGDLVFTLNSVETFRLNGVSRPAAFRNTCMHSQRSYTGVKEALEREVAPA